MKKEMKRFDGYLFSKLDKIGSKSEGPVYILQKWDYKEIPIVKKAELWKKDTALHKFLGKKVNIEGVLREKEIHYEKIDSFLNPDEPAEKLLDIDLKLQLKDDGVLWINKMPSPKPVPPSIKNMQLTLLVRWPYRSIWSGTCPTSQLYDFFIESPKGNVIWQWSKCVIFGEKPTLVEIPGGASFEFPVTWNYFDNAIELIGTYKARGVFIASGQEVSEEFEIKFAY